MAKTRIDFESDSVRAMDAYQKGNFKLYKGLTLMVRLRR